MRAKILTGLLFLTITLLVLTTFMVAYSRANEEFWYGMMENGHHRGRTMHDMTEEEHDRCEAMQGSTNAKGHMSTMHREHHNATTQEENYRQSCH